MILVIVIITFLKCYIQMVLDAGEFTVIILSNGWSKTDGYITITVYLHKITVYVSQKVMPVM